MGGKLLKYMFLMKISKTNLESWLPWQPCKRLHHPYHMDREGGVLFIYNHKKIIFQLLIGHQHAKLFFFKLEKSTFLQFCDICVTQYIGGPWLL